ncbi:MAG TPA: dihydropteroate synthase [Terriglobales bacterium]|jgi:dihydropteroate synthase|nr:dihydropteroate synthase [Terriglobales bacterium]
MRPVFTWSLGRRSLELGKRTVVMGILNVTPDSFSDGGLHSAPGEAVAHAMRLFEEGAAIVDIGGESTRPGAKAAMDKPAVNPEEEMRRVLPVIVALKESRPEAIISVDTYKSKVALAAVEAGADIINDVSGLQWDPKMGKTLAGLDCGVVVMHARGKPDEWASLSKVPDMVMLVKRELRERAEAAITSKIRRDRIVLDPGFGFGKRFEENYPLLRRFHEFHELYFPLMAGVSRKSWIGRALSSNGTDAAISERLFGTLGAEVALALKGAHIIRTHDVKSCVEALRLADVVAG